VNKPNTYRAGPDDHGRFGIFGGRFVAETLMPLILAVEKAYDEAKAVWYGSYRYPSKSSAQKGVIENCEANGGTACKLMLSYTNQCAAVARAVDHGVEIKGKDTVNTGSTQEEAEANATSSCVSDWGVKGCAVALSNCSHHSVARWSRWVYE
jgi:hypothetical protein